MFERDAKDTKWSIDSIGIHKYIYTWRILQFYFAADENSSWDVGKCR